MAVSERLQKKFFADKFPGMLMLYMNSILTVALFYQFEMSARSVQAKQAFFVNAHTYKDASIHNKIAAHSEFLQCAK
jgi:hypothetical protein